MLYPWAQWAFIDFTDNGAIEIVAAVLLVGLGTRIGSDCINGHRVCGIGRLSIRLLIATIVFVIAGIITALLTEGNQ